jgi:hypothetical protein
MSRRYQRKRFLPSQAPGSHSRSLRAYALFICVFLAFLHSVLGAVLVLSNAWVSDRLIFHAIKLQSFPHFPLQPRYSSSSYACAYIAKLN